MSNGKRSIGLFGVSGVLVAALIIAAFVAMGGIFQAQGKGTLTIRVTDAPYAYEALWLKIDEVEVEGEEGWTSLELNLGTSQFISFNLLALDGNYGIYATLAEGAAIPQGDYSMIKIHVLAAGTAENGEDLTIPSGEIKVLLQPKLHIGSEDHATILIDLQIEDVRAATTGNGYTVNIRPVVKAVTQDNGA
jgi:Domain of unknown function (DUF4382)